jgi:hypothetical protein
MPYSAGDLQVKILGSAKSATTAINTTIKALERLNTALHGISSLRNTANIVTKIEKVFNGLATAINSIDPTTFEKLSSMVRTLNSIGGLGRLEKMNFAKIGEGFASLTTAITPFIDKVITAETALQALNQTMKLVNGRKLKGLSSWSGNVGTGAGGKNKSGGGFFGALSKITMVYFVARRLGRAIADIAQAGADYTETLNLWETAMTRNLDQATAFVKKMNEAYGISEKTLMNAQATFKNMLGSLGQISESVAYALSEGVTQMAIDYASLYNVTFDKAFEKFQSALAGQVRPIRSVSGYDITENTIYELYKQLGGEKSVRNLSRTEKQLLAILAVFNQMTASGAVGDLNKTMESYANQSRVMAEAWSEMVSYAGILLTYIIQESQLFTKITAGIITITRYFKALANYLGAIKSFGGDIFGATEQSAENASNAIDELNGKLADFDKFRALNESNDTQVAIDEKLLNAMSKYSSILDGASIKARELSDQWLKLLGFTLNANGEIELTNDQIISAKNTIGGFINALKSVNILQLLRELFPLVGALLNVLKESAQSIISISNALSPLISNIFKIASAVVELLDRLGLLDAIVYVLLTYAITNKIITLGVSIGKLTTKYIIPMFKALVSQGQPALLSLKTSFDQLTAGVTMLQVAFSALGVAFATMSISAMWNSQMRDADKIINTIMAITAGLTALIVAISVLKKNWAQAIGIAGMVTGAYASIATLSYDVFANGGLPDKGTMFVAGEAGAEMVYNTPSGQSGVANIQQIAQANYNGTIKALNDWWGGMSAKQDIPKLQSANATGLYQAVTGVAKAQGERWSKY